MVRFFLFFFFFTSILSAQTHDVIYIHFEQNLRNNKSPIINNIETIINSLNSSNNFIFYSSDESYNSDYADSMQLISDRNFLLDNINDLVPSYFSSVFWREQIYSFNRYLSNNDIFNDLSSDNVLSGNINFHFIFNYNDFISKKFDKNIVEKLLFTNRLMNSKTKFSINKNCSVTIHLHKFENDELYDGDEKQISNLRKNTNFIIKTY